MAVCNPAGKHWVRMAVCNPAVNTEVASVTNSLNDVEKKITVVNQILSVSIKSPMSISQVNATTVIDMGAEITVMSSNYYEKLPEAVRLPLRPTIRGLVVAETGRKMGSSGVADIEFEMNGNRYKWPMYVAPIRDDVLLGSYFLYSFDATVSFSKGLSLGERSIDCKVQSVIPSCFRCMLMCVVVVTSGAF